MKTVRFVAQILFHLTRTAAGLFFLVALYATIVLVLSTSGYSKSLPIDISDKGYFTIFYPFTTKPFLIGDYTKTYIITSLSTVALYAIFLWLLSGVFNAFRQDRLFTNRGVLQLSRFYVANLTVPVTCLVLLYIFGLELKDTVIITFLHLMIGVFAFFMAAIFKQGLLLQEEQDLTL